MEFMNRGAAQPAGARVANGGGEGPAGKRGRWKGSPTWLRVTWIVLLFSATIVIAALATLLYLGGSKEGDFIDKDKQQAVFLTNGQVYFGKVNSVTSKYVDLRGVYYLNVNQQVQPSQKDQKAQSSITLVKLGCELHGPTDQMLINREQVTFWENLKDEGQVAKAIATWVKDNPNGQNCQTTTSNSSTTPSSKP
jgi:hypothetical protein